MGYSQTKSSSSSSSSSLLSSRSRDAFSNDISISDFFALLKHNRNFIIIVMLIFFVIAIMFLVFSPKKYKVDALIQVESKNSSITSTLENLHEEIGTGQEKASADKIEASLIQSRFILEPVVETLGLNILVRPKYSSIFSHIFSSQRGNVEVAKFIVPGQLSGKDFYLTVKDKNTYELYTESNKFVLKGKTNEEVKSDEKSAVPSVQILVSNLNAKPGEKFWVESKSLQKIIEKISKKLLIRDIGQKTAIGNAMADTGILEISFEGKDPEKIPKILNTILNYEVEKNVDKKSEEVQKTLSFLNDQLPILKENLDRAESKLSSYRAKKGSLGVNVEGNVLFTQLVTVQQELEQAKLKKAELLQKFTDEHPYIISINQQIKEITKSLNLLEKQVQSLPKTEQIAISLERDVSTRSQLYSFLLGKIQQLQVSRASTISDVRILVPADFATAISPNVFEITLGSIFFGFIFAIFVIFVRRIAASVVDDPSYLEDKLGIAVYALVPYSKTQVELSRAMQRKIPGSGPFILAQSKPKDIAIESLRSLRTTLQFALQESKNNIIAVLGGRPSIGKSFISLNLAKVFADSEQKILLVDADLRRGKIHSYLAQRKAPGLSEVLQGKCSVEEAKKTIVANKFFHFLPAGVFPENPAELLFNGKFKKFLEHVSSAYDIVLIDTPPVLAVTDALIIAKEAAINLFVVGAGVEPIKEIEGAVKRLQQGNVAINGFVFNNARFKNASYSNYGYYYEYETIKGTE